MITIDPPSSLSLDGSPDRTGAMLSGDVSLAVSKAALTRFLRRAQAKVGLVGEVSLLLTDDARMRELNRGFRGKGKTTDVLSFPAPRIPGLPAEFQHAGDLAISVPVAARQATEHGHALEMELRVLVLHGLLHLAGMDHEADAGEMRARELELRAALKLPSGLIERASAGAVAARTPAKRTGVGEVVRRDAATRVPVKKQTAKAGHQPAAKPARRTAVKRGVRA